MTRKQQGPRLSAGELQILDVLWRDAGLTLSQAHQALAKAQGRAVGYTTVQTRLNRLVKKGIVKRSADRPTRYEAAIAREQVSGADLDLLVQRVSGGVLPLVAHLVQSRRLTQSEVDELRQLIDEAEARCKKERPHE
jgi:BlaI family penicillinase repressor